MVPESAVSSRQAHRYDLVFSGQLVKVLLTAVAGMLFQPSLLLLVIRDNFCFFVSDLPLLLEREVTYKVTSPLGERGHLQSDLSSWRERSLTK